MDKGKIYRIIRGNGLKPENFIKIDKKDNSIYVDENGVSYKLNGFTKTILIPVDGISEEKAKETIKDLISEFQEDINISENVDIKNIEQVWKAPASVDNGLIKEEKEIDERKEGIPAVRTEEELKRIKAIKKPRGWHFRDTFTDSEGHVYLKGVLQ